MLTSLESYMKSHKLRTQAQAAEHFNVKQNTISRWLAKGYMVECRGQGARAEWTCVYAPMHQCDLAS